MLLDKNFDSGLSEYIAIMAVLYHVHLPCAMCCAL